MLRREIFNRTSDDAGAALVMVMLVAGLVLALGAGLITITNMDVKMGASQLAGLQALYGADAALTRTATEAVSAPTWGALLNGGTRSSWYDASVFEAALADPVDVVALTTMVNEGADACGANRPIWRIFGLGTFKDLARGEEVAVPGRAIVWVADDCAEEDADPAADGNGVIALRALAIGSGGMRRWREVVIHRTTAGVQALSWRERRSD